MSGNETTQLVHTQGSGDRSGYILHYKLDKINLSSRRLDSHASDNVCSDLIVDPRKNIRVGYIVHRYGQSMA